jgi:hypothetical protein
MSNKYSRIQKGKVVPVHALETYQRGGGIAPLIQSLGTSWRGVVSLTSLLPAKETPLTID